MIDREIYITLPDGQIVICSGFTDDLEIKKCAKQLRMRSGLKVVIRKEKENEK